MSEPVWNAASFDERVGALAREDFVKAGIARLRAQRRAGLLTADQYTQRMIELAREALERPTPRVTSDDVLEWSGQILSEFEESDDDYEEMDDAD